MNYIIYDFEATCCQGSRVEEMEIIEIGAVLDEGSFSSVAFPEKRRLQILS
jgi:inhibitor of KinA sporulation pathway (predicted exonuclease)